MQNQIEPTAPVVAPTPATPEHEIKNPFWRSPGFWLGAATVLITALDQLKHVVPADSAYLPAIGIAFSAALLLKEAIVGQSRNAASATVESARISAATSDCAPTETQILSGVIGGLATKQDIGTIVEGAARTGAIAALNQKRGQK